MEKRIYPQAIESIVTPEPYGRRNFDDARKAVAALQDLYSRNTAFLRDSFAQLAASGDSNKRYRAFYPEVGVTTTSFTSVDSRQAYGHMPTPGHFTTTITRPDLFQSYLTEQLQLIMRNHGVAVTVSESETPTCSTCRTSTAPTTTSPTERWNSGWATPGRSPCSPRNASTIRCTG